MKAHFFIVIFILSSVQLFSQNYSTDSSSIEKLFSGAVTGKIKADSVFMQLDVIKDRNENNPELLEIYDFYYAKFLMQTGQMDSAIVVAEKAINKYTDSTDLSRQIKFIKIIASSYAYSQDYQKGISYFRQALEICERIDNQEQAAYINNNIANLFFSLMDYENAYRYSKASFDYMKNHPENPYYGSILAILSVAESKTSKKDIAYKHAQEALKIASEQNNILALIVSNHALGDIEAEQGNYQESIKWFNASLKISDQYRQLHFSLLNHIGLLPCYIEIGEYDKAIFHGEEAEKIAKQLGNKNVAYSLKRKLALAYSKSGQNDIAFELMRQAHEIYKSTTNFETQEAINEILIKYDTEKKDKEIQQNKVKIMKQEVESSRFRFIISLLSFILILLIVLYLLIQQKNKLKLKEAESKLEKETLLAIIEGEEKERERLSSELHDGIASTLTSIRFKMENHPTEHSAELIKMITDAQIDTRRISHNLSPLRIEKAGLVSAMEQFSKENSTPETQIHFSNFCTDNTLSKETELMIYRIVQELVQNAIKHGKAKNIDIQFMCSDKQFNWSVEDDGVGFEKKDGELGQGLFSIQNRIERMNGSFNIDSSSEGTIVQLSIPF